MKKFFCLLLCSLTVLTLSSCSKNNKSETEQNNQSENVEDSVVTYNQDDENDEDVEQNDNDESDYTPSSTNYYESSGRSQFNNYEENSNCVNGAVVYEGTGDYYVIETQVGYTIAETYIGWLSEGDKVRGELNRYGFKYLIKNRSNEVRVYIEDFMLSKESSIKWMGEHHKLKSRDQSDYDAPDDSNDF